MSIEGILQLDHELLCFFNGSDNLFLDGVMTTLTAGYTWIPLYISLLYIVIKNNETMAQILLIVGGALFSVVLAGGVDDIIVKPLVARLRPLNDPMIKYALDTVSGIGSRQFSFFSAHSANAFAITTFFFWLIRSYLLSGFMLLWSFATAYTRLYLGMHYPSDVLVGMLWGIICGTAAYFLYDYIFYKKNARINYISSQYTCKGYDYSDLDIVVSVIILTFIYCMFSALIQY